ncbi:metal-dependent hydrolase [Thiotrichales bacterium 19S3-7]|nr:metal-dependent hydrolase [Thiotrichales bacterium 19S3-7]MCF6802957.1 metal-dependent hydrolase [Thiotrichales bacterium 19S3-11]
MANFNTHLTASVCLSSIASVCLYRIDMLTLNEAINLAMIGIAAGFIADTDSDNEAASALFFSLFGLIAAIVTLLNFTLSDYSILLNIIIFTTIYLGSRYGLAKLVPKLTQRRGIFHSIPMAVALSFAVTLYCLHILKLEVEVAWFAGVYVFFNYLLHLILDEVYAVDLANNSYRLSYFSSIKLLNLKPWWPYLICYLLITIMIYFLPSFESLIKGPLALSNFESIWQHLV